jgi:choline dehydrogenase-like flavoprotein
MSVSLARDFDDLRVGGSGRLDADVLVIGSGAGGATVAATAAERGLSVIVLEEGPYVPAARTPARMADSLARLWRHAGLTAAYGAPPVSYAEGRCIGGSTEINSAIFQRAPEAILADLAKRYRIRYFDAAALAPYYDWATRVVNAGA